MEVIEVHPFDLLAMIDEADYAGTDIDIVKRKDGEKEVEGDPYIKIGDKQYTPTVTSPITTASGLRLAEEVRG